MLRLQLWQALGSEARFEEMDRELALAESIGFNAVRLILAEEGFGVWVHDHDGFLARFDRALGVCAMATVYYLVRWWVHSTRRRTG